MSIFFLFKKFGWIGLISLFITCSDSVSENKTAVSDKTIPRDHHLGISGPDLKTLLPGPNFLKINSRVDSSVVKNGLLPAIKPILKVQMRDVSICLGGDGNYYLTGSTGDDIWEFNDGIELWRSSDLKKWDYLGLVWSFEKDATWQKEWRVHNDRKCRAIWAPELSYIKGNYYLTYSIPPGDRGILVSSTGKPEGPYVNALENDGKFEGEIDASLFVDEDGSVYLVYGSGWIVKMKEDMTGLDGEPVKPVLLNPDLNPDHHAFTCRPRRNCQDIGRESAFLFKQDGKYYLSVADTYEGRYSSLIAVADHITGPYRNRHEAVPCGGGSTYFKDKSGKWYCCFYGNDNQMPWREMPGLIHIDFLDDKVFVSVNQFFLK